MTNWLDFVSQIRQTFSSPLHREVVLKQVGNRVQGVTETVLHYFNDMMEIFDIIDVDMIDQYKVAYLKTGVQISLKKRNHETRSNVSTTVFGNRSIYGEKLDSSLNSPTNISHTE